MDDLEENNEDNHEQDPTPSDDEREENDRDERDERISSLTGRVEQLEIGLDDVRASYAIALAAIEQLRAELTIQQDQGPETRCFWFRKIFQER